MHETGLVRATVAALVDATAGRPMRTVVLAVGPGVDVGSAAAAWQTAAAGTCLEATKVEWQHATDGLRCFACGLDYNGETLDLCPSCDGTGLVITRAPELTAVDWTT